MKYLIEIKMIRNVKYSVEIIKRLRERENNRFRDQDISSDTDTH